MIVEIGKTLDLSNIAVVDPIPEFREHPLSLENLRVCQCDLDFQPVVARKHLDPLDDTQLVAGRNPQPVVDPVMMIDKVPGVDHESVSLPMADRFTVEAGNGDVRVRMLSPV